MMGFHFTKGTTRSCGGHASTLEFCHHQELTHFQLDRFPQMYIMGAVTIAQYGGSMAQAEGSPGSTRSSLLWTLCRPWRTRTITRDFFVDGKFPRMTRKTPQKGSDSRREKCHRMLGRDCPASRGPVNRSQLLIAPLPLPLCSPRCKPSTVGRPA